MKSYSIEVTKAAEKALLALPADILPEIDACILGLATTPRPDGCKKLRGMDNLYRVRVRNYRIVYQVIDRKLVIVIVVVADRKEVYEILKRRT
jgi:mRNA interferase RelE/StbE